MPASAPLFPATFTWSGAGEKAVQATGDTALATSEALKSPEAQENEAALAKLTDEDAEFLHLADEVARSDFDDHQGKRRAASPQTSAKENFIQRFNDHFQLNDIEKNIQLHRSPSDEQTANIRRAHLLLSKLDHFTTRELLQGTKEAKASYKAAAHGGNLEAGLLKIDQLFLLTHRSKFLGSQKEHLENIIRGSSTTPPAAY